jgi:YVTN family beta-propeller protein
MGVNGKSFSCYCSMKMFACQQHGTITLSDKQQRRCEIVTRTHHYAKWQLHLRVDCAQRSPGSRYLDQHGIATVPVASPSRSAITPDGASVYVPNPGSNTVSVISIATNTVTATISLGNNPFVIAFSSDAIDALTAWINALIATGALTQNQGDALLNKLDQIRAKIEAGQTNAAINQIKSQLSSDSNSNKLLPLRQVATHDEFRAVVI